MPMGTSIGMTAWNYWMTRSDCNENTIDGVDCGLVDHTLIFRDVDGKTYRASYDKPEEPEDWTPWEDEEEVECQEVVPIKTIKWVVKKEQE